MAINPISSGAFFSLRLGHAAALTCPRHVIHYRAAASLPKRGAKNAPPAYQIFIIRTPRGAWLRLYQSAYCRHAAASCVADCVYRVISAFIVISSDGRVYGNFLKKM